MKTFLSIILAFLLVTTIGCKPKSADNQASDLAPGMHTVTVIETKQTANYTYFQVFENDQKFWIATTILDAKKGDNIYYTDAFEMKDFKSKELNKTFESIFFINDASIEPIKVKKAETTGKVNPGQVADLNVTKVDGAITIAELFRDKQNYDGKEVSIRGVVVKYNRNIMGKNWAHIQDGSKHDESYDLTLTTNDTLAGGIMATFKGTIKLNKDFGSGYSYDVIMEDAKASDIENFDFGN